MNRARSASPDAGGPPCNNRHQTQERSRIYTPNYRNKTAAVGLAASLLVTVALWWYVETLAVFLFLPFVPFLFRGDGDDEAERVRKCPQCGFETTADAYEFCPRDGTRLD